MFEKFMQYVPQGSSQEIDWDGLYTLIPQLAALSSTPQDPIHHAEGDVLTHTKMVCAELLALPEYTQADLERRFVLFFAALLHDIAKPSCTVLEPEGWETPLPTEAHQISYVI